MLLLKHWDGRYSAGDNAESQWTAAVSRPLNINISSARKICIFYVNGIFSHNHNTFFFSLFEIRLAMPLAQLNLVQKKTHPKQEFHLLHFPSVFPLLWTLSKINSRTVKEKCHWSLWAFPFPKRRGRPDTGYCPSFRALPKSESGAAHAAFPRDSSPIMRASHVNSWHGLSLQL